jgi:cytochrome c oxidase subunit 2
MRTILTICCLTLAYGITRVPVLQAAGTMVEKQIVEITAVRFVYQPNTIRLHAGQATELHLRAMDILHGFYIPKLNIRADLEPGKTVTIVLPPLAKGVYPFACDNFCGTGHGEMQGSLLVE